MTVKKLTTYINISVMKTTKGCVSDVYKFFTIVCTHVRWCTWPCSAVVDIRTNWYSRSFAL